MAGGQQTLKTIVVLSGRVDNSFGIIGSELTQLGNKVNGVSSQLAQYGEESLNVYKNYEDGILETRSVLARQYSSSGELNKAMSSLEEHAQAWASTTIFHTNDVASAMATAAHAGWDYDKIISGLPASMPVSYTHLFASEQHFKVAHRGRRRVGDATEHSLHPVSYTHLRRGCWEAAKTLNNTAFRRRLTRSLSRAAWKRRRASRPSPRRLSRSWKQPPAKRRLSRPCPQRLSQSSSRAA